MQNRHITEASQPTAMSAPSSWSPLTPLPVGITAAQRERLNQSFSHDPTAVCTACGGWLGRKNGMKPKCHVTECPGRKFVLPGVDPAEPPKTFVGGKTFVSTNTRLPKKLAGSPPGHREFAAARHTDSSMPEHPFGADNAMAASRSLPALGRAASPSKVR